MLCRGPRLKGQGLTTFGYNKVDGSAGGATRGRRRGVVPSKRKSCKPTDLDGKSLQSVENTCATLKLISQPC